MTRTAVTRTLAACPLAALGLGLLACGETDGPTTYRDVAPIFEERCTLCHYAGSPIDVNIVDPFEAQSGLVYRKNTWWEEYGEEGGQEYNVVPHDPDASFLMVKLRDPSVVGERVGSAMPFRPPALAALTPEEIGAVRAWIDAGAEQGAYEQSVFRILGDGESFGTMGKCGYCHYAGTPYPPDLTRPFDPEVGLVGVAARFDPQSVLVEPGNADASFLVRKVEASEPEEGLGAPMPYPFEPLSDGELAVVRQWIVDGALP